MVEQKKYQFVDALRGWAILLVIMAHTPTRIASLSAVGAAGVQLFFVVSAFTLFLSLDVKYGREAHPVANFFVRRFFRIVPAFYFAAVFYLLKNGFGASPWAPDGIGARQIVGTLFFINGFDPASINAVVPGGWSIAVEMLFYLMVPACFVFVTNIYRALAMAVVLAAVTMILDRTLLPWVLEPYASHQTIMNWFPSLWFPAQVCIFPFGFAMFFAFKEKAAKSNLGTAGAAALVGLVIALLYVVATAQNVFVPRAFLLGFVFAMFGLVLAKQPLHAFVNPVTCYIGKISFSLYLFHFVAIDMVLAYAPSYVQGGTAAATALIYLAITIIGIVIASVTYHLLEKPGQELGRRLIQWRERRADPRMGDIYTKSW